jgi:hypothetical protein
MKENSIVSSYAFWLLLTFLFSSFLLLINIYSWTVIYTDEALENFIRSRAAFMYQSFTPSNAFSLTAPIFTWVNFRSIIEYRLIFALLGIVYSIFVYRFGFFLFNDPLKAFILSVLIITNWFVYRGFRGLVIDWTTFFFTPLILFSYFLSSKNGKISYFLLMVVLSSISLTNASTIIFLLIPLYTIVFIEIIIIKRQSLNLILIGIILFIIISFPWIMGLRKFFDPEYFRYRNYSFGIKSDKPGYFFNLIRIDKWIHVFSYNFLPEKFLFSYNLYFYLLFTFMIVGFSFHVYLKVKDEKIRRLAFIFLIGVIISLLSPVPAYRYGQHISLVIIFYILLIYNLDEEKWKLVLPIIFFIFLANMISDLNDIFSGEKSTLLGFQTFSKVLNIKMYVTDTIKRNIEFLIPNYFTNVSYEVIEREKSSLLNISGKSLMIIDAGLEADLFFSSEKPAWFSKSKLVYSKSPNLRIYYIGD